MTLRWLALIALIPALTGPLPAAARGGSIVVALCSGGSIEIPLDDDDSGDDNAPCHPQGCHGTNCRKRFDLKQGRAAQPLE